MAKTITKEELKDRLRQLDYNRLRENEKEYLDKLLVDTSKAFYFSSFIVSYAIHSFFIEKDLQKAKQYFYLIGKLTIYNIVLNNTKFTFLEEEVCFLLLSDHLEMIDKFSRVRPDSYDRLIKTASNVVPMIQAVLREDWEHLKELNSYLKYHIENERGWKSYQADLMFFEAFLEKDKDKMKEAIEIFIRKYHKRRYDMPLFNQLISIPALGYAKLAYLKGYELDINNELIPKELLPVKPNKEYWNYDFMKQGVYKDV